MGEKYSIFVCVRENGREIEYICVCVREKQGAFVRAREK